MVKAFFTLVRWPNLLIIALVQYLIRYCIIESLAVPHILSRLNFLVGVICSICLAAAGNVINDIFDQETDTRNKPQRKTIGVTFTENQAWYIYFGLSIIALASGYYLSEIADLGALWLIPPLATFLLYLYATDLKERPVIGNTIVSLLTAMPVLLIGVFDVLPAANADNWTFVKSVLQVIIGYSAFAFFSNFIRELVKDAEDIEGDKAMGFRTLAVLVGLTQIRYIIIILALILLVVCGFITGFLWQSDILSSIYVALCINLPLIIFMWLIFKANAPMHFKRPSQLIKIVMVMGILSMAIFTLSVQLKLG